MMIIACSKSWKLSGHFTVMNTKLQGALQMLIVENIVLLNSTKNKGSVYLQGMFLAPYHIYFHILVIFLVSMCNEHSKTAFGLNISLLGEILLRF